MGKLYWTIKGAEISKARSAGEAGQRYKNTAGGSLASAKELDDANAAGYAQWAEKDYVSKYGDTGRVSNLASTRSAGLARGGSSSAASSDDPTSSKKAKRLFSDINVTSGNGLISA